MKNLTSSEIDYVFGAVTSNLAAGNSTASAVVTVCNCKPQVDNSASSLLSLKCLIAGSGAYAYFLTVLEAHHWMEYDKLTTNGKRFYSLLEVIVFTIGAAIGCNL